MTTLRGQHHHCMQVQFRTSMQTIRSHTQITTLCDVTRAKQRSLATRLIAVACCAVLTTACSDLTDTGSAFSVQRGQPTSSPQPTNSGSIGAGPTDPTERAAVGLTGPGAVQANATVVRLSDGDTITIQFADGGEEAVRLIGIDTPETKRPNTPVQCFGPEASRFIAALLPAGTRVRIERDVEERDRYGRLLGYIYRASDGLFVNLSIARNGYANALTYPPNVAHVDEFADAVRAARDEGRGLWRACPATVGS